MKLRAIFSLLLGTLWIIHPSQAYYGRNSTEAILSYEAQIEVPKHLSTKGVLSAIDGQIQFLMGTFQSASFIKQFPFEGTLGEGYTYEIVGKAIPGREEGRLIYKYRFKGKVVFNKAAFKNTGSLRTVPLRIPLAPDQIYNMGFKNGDAKSGDLNLCTDSYYNTEGDFWYFWDPEMKGCPLKENKSDVIHLDGKLEELPNTTLTYFELDQIYGFEIPNKTTVRMGIFIGYVDQINHINKAHYKDEAYASYKYVISQLKELGMTLDEELSKKTFREYSNKRIHQGADFLQVWKKEAVRFGKKVTLQVKVLLSDTAIDSTDKTFHIQLAEEFKEDDLFAYDGHSGLGANNNLDELPNLHIDHDMYQVCLFNGCSSYSYYPRMYQRAKNNGSKKIDIIASALETSSAVSGPNIMAFADLILNDKHGAVSCQYLLDRIEESNGDTGTTLTGIIGDADNKFNPATFTPPKK